MKLEQLAEYGSKGKVIQNLKDAGCTRKTMESCIGCMERGEKNRLVKQLEEHRKDLLDKVHQREKQIDCTDYLLYQIGRCESETDEM